jgi:hypothetical protein
MRQQTLQEQYNLIVEGKGSTHAFHKQALKQFPHLFTAQSSFDQVITVLKQKSIISEMVAQGLVSNSSGPNFFEIFNTNMAKLNEEAKAESKKADEEVVKAEKKTAKDKSAKYLNNQNGSEFLLGFYVESKNIKYVDKTVDQIKDIVVKNLSKDPLYYVKSGQFGLEELGYKEDVPGLGPTKEVKGKYASSGMEPVKLKESKKINENQGVQDLATLLGTSTQNATVIAHALSMSASALAVLLGTKLGIKVGDTINKIADKNKVKEAYGNEIDVPNPSMLLQMDRERLGKVIDKMDNNDMQAFKRKFDQAEVSIKNALKDKLRSFGLDKAFNLGESKDELVKEILKRLTKK